MECAVCGTEAEEINPPTFDAKSIRCPNCGDYDISGATWDMGVNRHGVPAPIGVVSL
jgi:rRNA maturation protein Nop10